METLLQNWVPILFALLAFIKIIVRITPSTQDNDYFHKVGKFINIIFPNRKIGGGTH
jgi:hypothetical protein